jgi:tetratricopeptide (TPR) repeat protein
MPSHSGRIEVDGRRPQAVQLEEIWAALNVSWDLAGGDPKDVLRVMAHLAPVAVPLRLLRASLGWQESAGVADRVEKALADLSRLWLIDRSATGEPLAHRLILAFVRRLPASAASWLQASEAVREEMSRTFDERDTASFQELEGILPHAESVLSRADLSAETAITIATALGRHHVNLGRYVPAKSFYQEALGRAERSYPPGHPSIATSQSNLALVLEDLGELAEARDLLRQALASDERSNASTSFHDRGADQVVIARRRHSVLANKRCHLCPMAKLVNQGIGDRLSDRDPDTLPLSSEFDHAAPVFGFGSLDELTHGLLCHASQMKQFGGAIGRLFPPLRECGLPKPLRKPQLGSQGVLDQRSQREVPLSS